MHIIHTEINRPTRADPRCRLGTPNLLSDIVDFRGFDSSTILILRGGIPRPEENLPESLSQAILVGVMLVGRLGIDCDQYLCFRTSLDPNKTLFGSWHAQNPRRIGNTTTTTTTATATTTTTIKYHTTTTTTNDNTNNQQHNNNSNDNNNSSKHNTTTTTTIIINHNTNNKTNNNNNREGPPPRSLCSPGARPRRSRPESGRGCCYIYIYMYISTY